MSDELELTHTDDEQGGGFYLHRGDEKVGEITYTRDENSNLLFDHTWVDDSLRGQGRAGELFRASMSWVRENDHKVIPVCSYVVGKFERDPALADLRA